MYRSQFQLAGATVSVRVADDATVHVVANRMLHVDGLPLFIVDGKARPDAHGFAATAERWKITTWQERPEHGSAAQIAARIERVMLTALDDWVRKPRNADRYQPLLCAQLRRAQSRLRLLDEQLGCGDEPTPEQIAAAQQAAQAQASELAALSEQMRALQEQYRAAQEKLSKQMAQVRQAELELLAPVQDKLAFDRMRADRVRTLAQIEQARARLEGMFAAAPVTSTTSDLPGIGLQPLL